MSIGKAPMRRVMQTALAAAVVVPALLAGGSSSAQSYPDRPVTLIVPFTPGGSVDAVGRLVGEALGEQFDTQFVVENRPGAAANIGYADVARAADDGYTLLVAYSSATVCNPALFANLNWSEKDFVPVGIVTSAPMVATVNPSLPVNSIGEFIAYAKEHPGEMSYGSSGVGSQAHLGNVIFQQITGTDMVHVPYKGSGDLLPDLLSGQIQMAFGLPASFLQQINAGSLKPLAVTGTERDPFLPNVPTLLESGVQMVNEGWHGVMAPAGTPPDVVEALSAKLKLVSEDPAFVERANKAGIVIRFTGPEEANQRIAQETVDCAAAVASSGIQLE